MANIRSQLTSTGSKYGITITLPSSYCYMQNFDIVNLEKSIDCFNVSLSEAARVLLPVVTYANEVCDEQVMTYDLHVSSEADCSMSFEVAALQVLMVP